MNGRRNPWRAVTVLVLGLLLAGVTTTPASAAVTVLRAEMKSGELRLEGRALASRTITVDGVALGTSDGSGEFRIERSFTPPADCTVDVNDGSATPTNARLSGCTVTSPSIPTPSSLALSPDSVTGGESSTGTVTLASSAPSGGQSVGLASSNGAVASVPASVTVPAGSTSTTFTVTTTSVTQTSSVTISATAGGVSRSTSLTVTPGASSSPTLTGLSLNPDTVVEGSNSTGTVTLSAAAPTGGVVVSLTSGNTAAATVPVSVTVPAGASSASFTVVSGTTSGTSSSVITAVAAGVSRTALFTVTTDSPTLSNLSITPLSVTGGSSATGTLTLTAPATDGGITVTLSSDSTIVSVPANVTVAPGASTASFTVTTTPVTTSQSTIIRAAHGTESRAFTLSVTPEASGPAVTSVTLNEDSVVGGTPVTGTVRLDSAAPSGGTTVFLSSDNTAAATVPPSVAVAAGAATATFTVETKPTTNSQSSLIVAEAGGGRVGAVITVTSEFSANNGSVSLARGGNGEGRVTSSPAGIDCTFTRDTTTGTCSNAFLPAGTQVRLTARAADGSRFRGWDFEVSCPDAPDVTIHAGVGHICRPVFQRR